MISQKFVEERAKYSAETRKQSLLAYDLMMEFLKLREGDVSMHELSILFHRYEMPFPSTLYPKARAEAGLPPRKRINRHDPHSRTRMDKLKAQFAELIDTTPDNKRPRHVKPKAERANGVNQDAEVQIKAVSSKGAADLRNLEAASDEDLIAAANELKRRYEAAKDLIATVEDM